MAEIVSLKAGSRKSQLALIQTNHVIDKIKEWNPNCSIELIAMTTKGDNVLDKPLPKVGKNVFTKELEEPLVDGELDFVVHSMKDVSTSLPEGLTIGAVLEREDPLDVVITKKELKGTKLKDLPSGSVIGTSSLRRAAQLRAHHPHLIVRDIRGNLNTRLRKLDESGLYTAIVLALAGVRRMGWEERVSQVLAPTEMLYAVGQGALAVQCRTDDTHMMNALSSFNDSDTVLRVIAERSFMQALGGGCTAPLAVDTKIENDTLTLTGGVWSLCGKTVLKHTQSVVLSSESDEPPRKQANTGTKEYTGITAINVDKARLAKAHELGIELATHLKTQGAAEVIASAKLIVEQPSSPKPELEIQKGFLESNGKEVVV